MATKNPIVTVSFSVRFAEDATALRRFIEGPYPDGRRALVRVTKVGRELFKVEVHVSEFAGGIEPGMACFWHGACELINAVRQGRLCPCG